jgi:Ca2+-binding RTX toxin-like protein
VATITGTEGNDRLTGSAMSNDSLYGLGGNDVLVGQNGNDTLEGGDGADSLYGDYEASGPTDVGGNDVLDGGAGNDLLRGGIGDDRLTGGAGDDLLDGGQGIDWARYDDAAAGVTVDLNRQGVAQDTGGSGTDTLVSIEYLTGSRHGDLFIGDGAANSLTDDGGDGDDRFFGNGGADLLSVRRSGTGAATHVTLSGGADNDAIFFAGSGRYSDVVTLDGGSGNDSINVSGVGTGTISAGAGADQVMIDTLGGQYRISLGADADRLVLAGTAGGFRAASAIVVTDFATGAGGDALVLDGWIADLGLTNYIQGTNPFLDGHLRLLQSGSTQSGPDTLLQVDRNGGGDSFLTVLTLLDTKVTAFTAANLGGYAGTPPTSLSVTGTAGADTLTGGSDNDVLIGLEGNDTLNGGDGQDILYGDYEGSNATQSGDDTLNGGAGGDLLVGGLGNDRLNGGAGDDQIYGGIAAGGYVTGFNAYATDNPSLVAGGNDIIDGGAGIDIAYLTFVYRPSVTVNISNPNVISRINSGDGGAGSIVGVERLWVFGSDGADNLTGGAYSDTLIGSGGNDNLHGGGGDDLLSGGADSDLIDGGAGNDTVSYESSAYEVTVDLNMQGIVQPSVGDTLVSIENIIGSGKSDILRGDANANIIDGGGSGNDWLYGNDGADILSIARSGIGIATNVFLSGGGDADTISFSGAGRYVDTAKLDGGNGDDVISASGLVIGEISAGSGNDRVTIDTQGGFYAIDLGTGSDTLILAATTGGAHATSGITISDFTAGAGGDMIDLSAWLASGALTNYVGGSNPLRDGHLGLVQSGSDTLLKIDRDGGGDSYVTLMTLKNTLIGDFTAENFGGFEPAPVPTIATIGDIMVIEGDSGTTEATFTVTLAEPSTSAVTIAYATADGLAVAGADYIATSGTLTIAAGETSGTILVPVIGDLLGDLGESFRLVLSSPFGAMFAGGTTTISATASIINDELVGTGQNDVLTGTSAAEGIYGQSGNDTLYGLEGNDMLGGGEGNDLILGGPGDDRLDGGFGIDTLSYDDATGGVTVNLALPTAQNSGGGGTDTLSGFENLTGSGFDDMLIGEGGDNVIRGGAGDDSLDGRGGNDIVIGGAGSDELIGGDGIDTVSYEDATSGVTVSLAVTTLQITGGSGNDLLGGFENLVGSAFDDDLTGDAGNNDINAGEGDDILEGGLGNNLLNGGNGFDIASYAGAAAGVKVSLAATGLQTSGGAGRDRFISIEGIEGSAFGDLLTGSDGNDILYGRDGNDTIAAAGGDDLLVGGAANDKLDGGLGVDTASYADATGAVTVSLEIVTVQHTGGAGNDMLNSIENLVGSAFKDELTGDAGANHIEGGGGNDLIDGGLGDDLLDGGLGIDTVSYAGAAGGVHVSLALSGSQDTVSGGTDTLTGFENLTGSAFADMLTGDAANNRIAGGDGDDILVGGLGQNLLDGGDGFDFVSYAGATGGVRASLALTRVQTTSGSGRDQYIGIEGIEGSSFGDLLTGSDGDDIIYGRDGNDTITAGAGNDLLIGDAGSDRLTGGAGTDSMTGGARGDQFIFLAASDSAVGAGDIITDFHHGEKDRIDLNGIFGGAANFIGSDAFTGHAGEIRYALAGSDLLLSGDVDGNGIADFEIHLLGISTIGASDFVF